MQGSCRKTSAKGEAGRFVLPDQFQSEIDLEQSNFETQHPELTAKMNFAYSSFARTRLAPSSVRAFSK